MLRRAMFRWLLPASVILPLWLLIGWIIFSPSAWSLLAVLFIFMPSVFIGQLIVSLLVRSRPSVARSRAVSWQDLGVIGLWHLLTIAVGLYWAPAFAAVLILAIAMAVVSISASIRQLVREGISSARSQRGTFRMQESETGAAAHTQAAPAPIDAGEFIVIREERHER